MNKFIILCAFARLVACVGLAVIIFSNQPTKIEICLFWLIWLIGSMSV
jgi:hypothetical protein